MPVKVDDATLVKHLREQLDGKPARCMAISTRTGERCKKVAAHPNTAYCGHHKGTQRKVIR